MTGVFRIWIKRVHIKRGFNAPPLSRIMFINLVENGYDVNAQFIAYRTKFTDLKGPVLCSYARTI